MISDIPRNSGKEKAVSDFIKKFAEDRGYETYQDEFHHVIVYVPASEGMEDRDSVMIQGHTDMVCVKESGNVHNFDTDSLELYTENGMLRAKGTTLGGDDGIAVAYMMDGIAVAYMMSIMDNKKIKHPTLECVFTSDEEGSFIGAENLDMSKLKSKTLINIDSEEEDVIIASCAGGMAFENRIKFERVESKLENPDMSKLKSKTLINIDSEEEDVIIASCAGGMAFENRIKFERVESKLENPVACKLKISGLKGGHSGSDIHRGRANAIKLAAENRIKFERVESKLENPVACKLKISGLKGGHSGSDIHRGRANAIKLAAEVLENIMIDNIEFELVVACKLKISGLKGGHSGSDIHRGRANAIKLAAEVLENIMIDNIEFELVSIESGEAPNVIPSKSETVILVEVN